MKKTLIILAAAVLAAAFPVGPMALAADRAAVSTPVNAEVLLNEFLATYAKAHVDWKAALEQISSPETCPPGKQVGQSSVIGYYAFRPKLWSELTPELRKAALRDPRLTAFIISRVSAAQFPVAGIQEPESPQYPIEGVEQKGKAPLLLPVVAPPAGGPVSNVVISPEQLISEKPIEVNLK